MTHVERVLITRAFQAIHQILLMLVQHVTGYKDITTYSRKELSDPFIPLANVGRILGDD